jgi:RNA polymerase sigma factor (sigma-70 family)
MADSAAAQAIEAQQFTPGAGRPDLGGFEAFYRDTYREVLKTAMIAGATQAEAEDAASEAFVYMLQRWPVTGAPLSYARKAVVSNFIKEKTRGNTRTARRLIERGHVSRHGEGTGDTGLDAMEGHDWVAGALSQLTPAQRDVMTRVIDGFTTDEIAEKLGKSKDAVRRSLCDARARLVQILNPDGGTADQARPATERPPREEAT